MTEDTSSSIAPRVHLKLISASEAKAVLAGIEPEGVRFGDGYPNEITREVMARVARSNGDDGSATFAIVRSSDGRAIGGIGFWFPEGPDLPRVGYDVIEPLRGQGFATEALSVLRDLLFARPEIAGVRADTDVEHWASRKVMEKAGMTHIGDFTGEEDGKAVDFVLYEVRRPADVTSGS